MRVSKPWIQNLEQTRRRAEVIWIGLDVGAATENLKGVMVTLSVAVIHDEVSIWQLIITDGFGWSAQRSLGCSNAVTVPQVQ